MRINRFYAEGFKRIRVVEITPDGALVQVTGANGSGKSSVLDAIYAALAGKKAIDPQPVRRGEESAVVELDLGKIKVTRKFRADGETQLYVTAEDGARYSSPQTMLDKLLGQLTFDPLEFMRLEAKGQSDALRRLVTLDVDVEALDRESALDYQRRRDLNRDIEKLDAYVRTLAEDVAKCTPPEPADVAALLAQMETASQYNADIERQKAVQQRERDARAEVERQLDAVNAEIAKLARRRREIEQALEAAQNLIDAHVTPEEPIDVAELRAKVQHGQEAQAEANRQATLRRQHANASTELTDTRQAAQVLTDRITERTQRKRTAIAAAAMPIDGLSFGEDLELLYNGIPLQQASSAEQLRVSVAIAMAMNPKLRVLRIKDGSLLDELSLRMLADMVEAADFQCWIEQVDTSGAVGVYMEDGGVAALNGAPVEAVAT